MKNKNEMRHHANLRERERGQECEWKREGRRERESEAE